MTMPAGTYVVCDLCYIFTEEEWREVCSLTIKGNECLSGEFQLADGRRFAMFSTMYGDGEYPTNRGGSLGVDSGSIGCILLEDIPDGVSPNTSQITVELDRPFEPYYDEGKIVFGDVVVDTSFEEDDEDDQDWDEAPHWE